MVGTILWALIGGAIIGLLGKWVAPGDRDVPLWATVLCGVGGGWNADEMENHGTEFKTRFKLMRERIEAMKEIWTKPKANITATWSILTR